jgi:hypothetical protein
LAFLLTSAVVIFGIGTSLNPAACGLGSWWCILLYATTKIAIYVFLCEWALREGLIQGASVPIPRERRLTAASFFSAVERVRIVHTNRLLCGADSSRFSSKWYRAALLLGACWIGVAIAMITGFVGIGRSSASPADHCRSSSRISYIRERDGACVIGLKLFATALMVSGTPPVSSLLLGSFVARS